MASLADIDDEEVDDVTAAAQRPHQKPPTQQGDAARQQRQEPREELEPQQQQQPQQQMRRVRPLVIRQVETATKGKGRIKPRRAQLDDAGADGGANLLANIPRIDGA